MKLAVAPAKWLKGLVFLLLLATLTVSAGSAQEPAQPVAAATAPSFDDIKTALDEAEATVDDEAVTAEKLAELRQTINDLASKLRDQLGEAEPRAKDAAERLKQLGAAPAKDEPADSEDIANERKELTADASALDGEVKAARLLLLRADQLSERVSEKRHALYARELFARTQSILDPQFWLDASNALPVEWRRLDGLIASWQQAVGESGSRNAFIGAALSLVAIVLLIYLTGRGSRPSAAALPDAVGASRAWRALRVFAWTALPPALAALAAFLLARALGLLTLRVEQIAQAVVAAIAVAAIGRGVAVALFAPRQPLRRLALLDDEPAAILCSFLVWASGALALTITVQTIHKAVFAPLVVTVATNALFAAITAGLLSLLVARLGWLKRQQTVGTFAVQWVQPLALIMACLISAALLAGFAGFAAFMALRTIVAAVVFSALYLFLEATKAFFAGSGELTTRRQALAAHLGVTTDGLGLIGAMLSGAIRLVLVALSCLVIIGPWEISTADLFDTIRNVPFGFKIAEIHVSLMAVLGTLVVFGVLILVIRMARHWLEQELLPRTRMEPSLQQSIATIFGYVGVIAAIALALGNLGIDLQKIALVAGALSVGIGFGLQSIVSNFVSGLILLAERPIRAGDSIVVKGEEGWVRRIRVRATEIETFDRASVIIPNSELITGVVKNWTRANTLGRIIIKVGASYDADPEKVRDILLGTAKAHPQIVQTPAPAAYLLGFGASALEFELRCIVLNVESTLSVKSDLHFAIIKAFREAGIEMSSDLLSESAARREALEGSGGQGKDQSIRRAV
jgi:small-conductance mechanosensitive channel